MSDQKTRRGFLRDVGKTTIGLGILGATLPVTNALGGPLDEVNPKELGVSPRSLPEAEAPLRQNGLLHGIPQDKPFSGRWTLAHVYGPVAGGLTLLLQKKGGSRPVRVDLCLLGDEPKAPATTRYLELFVMDGGGGEGCIEEDLFDALAELASVIKKNERDPRLLEGLLTFEERWDLYPDFMARAAVELEPGVDPEG